MCFESTAIVLKIWKLSLKDMRFAVVLRFDILLNDFNMLAMLKSECKIWLKRYGHYYKPLETKSTWQNTVDANLHQKSNGIHIALTKSLQLNERKELLQISNRRQGINSTSHTWSTTDAFRLWWKVTRTWFPFWLLQFRYSPQHKNTKYNVHHSETVRLLGCITMHSINVACCYLGPIVCVSICLLETTVGPIKTAKPIKVPFLVGRRNHYLGAQIP